MKQTIHLYRFILLLFLLPGITGTIQAQYVKPGDIIYENDALTGTTPQGVVCWVSPDGYTGWMVNLKDDSENCRWSLSTGIRPGVVTTNVYSLALADTCGWQNTKALRNYNSIILEAANVIQGEGWYLPALGQLRQLAAVLPEVNRSLEKLGENAGTIQNFSYWSSTGYDATTSWQFSFYDASMQVYTAIFLGRVRSIRSFSVAGYFNDLSQQNASFPAGVHSSGSILNSILYGNTDHEGSANDIVNEGRVDYSATGGPIPAGNNFTVEETDFVAAQYGNYHPAGNSSLKEAGNISLLPLNYLWDLDRQPVQSNGKTAIGAYQTTVATGIPEVVVSEFSVYPNPVKDKCIIKHPYTTGNKIKLYDLTGTLKASFPVEGDQTIIDLSEYREGVYLLRYNMRTVRVIKN